MFLFCSWLERNVPVYYSQAVEVLGPGLEIIWEKSRYGAIYVAQHFSTFFVYLKDNLPGFIQWVSCSDILDDFPSSRYTFQNYLT